MQRQRDKQDSSSLSSDYLRQRNQYLLAVELLLSKSWVLFSGKHSTSRNAGTRARVQDMQGQLQHDKVGCTLQHQQHKPGAPCVAVKHGVQAPRAKQRPRLASCSVCNPELHGAAGRVARSSCIYESHSIPMHSSEDA